jgi:deoxyribonuclease-4
MRFSQEVVLAILGSHLSITGGYHKAVERAAAVGCDCVQIFTKNNNQWRAKPLTPDECSRFRAALAEHKIQAPLAHNSYLINLASPDETLWQRSLDAMVVELQRAHDLGIPYLVAHPGAFTTSSEEEGTARIVLALDRIHQQTEKLESQVLLEVTAGQGTCLGWRFEHLADILGGVRQPGRLGVCFDTCHAFAAGYPLGTPEEYEKTMQEFDRVVGLPRIKAFHLNDSKKGLGSRVDRHHHIGEGLLGLEPFRLLLADPRFRDTPMYLETEKGERDGVDLDVINLATLRGLMAKPAGAG